MESIGLTPAGSGAYAEKAKKEKTQRQAIGLDQAFGQLIGSALASAQSLKKVPEAIEKNIIVGVGQMLGENVGGFFGPIISGGFGLLANVLFNKEEGLPVTEGALNVRVIEDLSDRARLA